MNTKTSRLVRAACLTMTYFLLLYSLLGGGPSQRLAHQNLHIIAGSILLVGVLVHIRTNTKWIRKIIPRPGKTLSPRIRQLRAIDSILLASGTFCAGSALMWGLNQLGLSVIFVKPVHIFSGWVMILALFVHLVQHWAWMKNTFQSFRQQQNQTAR